MEINLERTVPVYNKVKELNTDEKLWICRNIIYDLVSYYGENSKGEIYNGNYTDMQIEQATRLQQNICGMIKALGQVFNNQTFSNDYFEDLITGDYYSKYIRTKKESEEYKEKADKYDSLMY